MERKLPHLELPHVEDSSLHKFFFTLMKAEGTFCFRMRTRKVFLRSVSLYLLLSQTNHNGIFLERSPLFCAQICGHVLLICIAYHLYNGLNFWK